MKNLIIIGAGGFGRELESYLSSIPTEKRDWQIKGYLDDNPLALMNKKSNYKILGSIDEYVFDTNEMAILGIASIAIKQNIVNKLERKKVNFFTFISETAFVGVGVLIGTGSVICPNVIVPNNSTIGSYVTINIGTTVGHDSVIGNFCSIMPAVNIGGESVLGDNVFIGTGSNIIPRISIVENVFIGIGSVVIKSITEAGTYFGNPARKMR